MFKQAHTFYLFRVKSHTNLFDETCVFEKVAFENAYVTLGLKLLFPLKNTPQMTYFIEKEHLYYFTCD